MSLISQLPTIKPIEELLPHRAPFLFVKEIVLASQDEVRGHNTFDQSDFICKHGKAAVEFVPGMILIEAMAQCGGAGARSLGVSDGLFGLATIETASFHKPLRFGEKVEFIIKNIRISSKMIKQSGIAYVQQEPVAEATWMCIKLQL
jgi:3-hydroxyacyl-[acyl-carrier-protein] dehydratase